MKKYGFAVFAFLCALTVSLAAIGDRDAHHRLEDVLQNG